MLKVGRIDCELSIFMLTDNKVLFGIFIFGVLLCLV